MSEAFSRQNTTFSMATIGCNVLQFTRPKKSADAYAIPRILNTSCSSLLLCNKRKVSFLLDMVNFELMKISIAEHSSDAYIVEPICQNTMPKVTEIPNVFRKRATFSSGFFQKEQFCFHRHAMHCALKFGQYLGGKCTYFVPARGLLNSATRSMFSLQIPF